MLRHGTKDHFLRADVVESAFGLFQDGLRALRGANFDVEKAESDQQRQDQCSFDGHEGIEPVSREKLERCEVAEYHLDPVH
ncbi:hypothetical protein [Gymnodinialimonas ulvae]|uniref:hypothetical protein n=1 Tax=Gymnodinialimonas ulvae TaxID=3126504 RepID=UPI003F6E4441